MLSLLSGVDPFLASSSSPWSTSLPAAAGPRQGLLEILNGERAEGCSPSNATPSLSASGGESTGFSLATVSSWISCPATFYPPPPFEFCGAFLNLQRQGVTVCAPLCSLCIQVNTCWTSAIQVSRPHLSSTTDPFLSSSSSMSGGSEIFWVSSALIAL